MKKNFVCLGMIIIMFMLLIPVNSIMGGFSVNVKETDSPLFLFRLKQHKDISTKPVRSHYIQNDFEFFSQIVNMRNYQKLMCFYRIVRARVKSHKFSER